jgi:hypothetical protein
MIDPHEKNSTQLIVDKKSLSEFNIHTLLNKIILNAENYLLKNPINNADLYSITPLKEACLAWAQHKMQPEEIAHLIYLLLVRYPLIDPVIKKYLDEVKEILEIIGISPKLLSTNPYHLFSKTIESKPCTFENNATKEHCLIM